MAKVFSLDFQVRDYELDQFGVVNNSVYQNYLEHTRHEFMQSLGIDPAQLAHRGASLALSEIHLHFRSALRSRDAFRVVLTVAEIRGARVVLRQRIVRVPDASPVLEARVVAVVLDEAGKPRRLPQDYRERFGEYLEAK